MTITVDLLDTDGTFIKTLSNVVAESRGFRKERVGAGAGSLTIANDHADYAALSDRRLIRVKLDGSAVFTWMLRRRSAVRLSQEGGEGGQVTVRPGPGALAVLGGGSGGDSAVVVGDRDSGYKRIGWMTRTWDDSAWSEPTDRGFVGDGPDGGEWPDPEAQFLGSAQGGDPSYLRRFMDVSVRPTISSDDIPTRLFLIGKGAWTAWWDGEQIATGEPWEVVTVEIGPLSLDGHQFAMEVESGAGAMTLCALDADNEITGVLYRSFTQAVYGTGSAEPWVGKESGAAPDGVTAGLVAKTLIDEAQARGSLAGVSYTFTNALDTDGAAWSVELPQVTYSDGVQVGDVIRQLRQQFSVDAQMSPSLELQLYDSFGTDLSGTIQLTDATAAAAGAILEEEGPSANVVRIGTTGGFGWSGGATGVPAGETHRLETGVHFGTASSIDEVSNAATELIDDSRGTVRQVVTTSGPTGKRPLVDYDVGDWVAVREAAGGSYVTARVEAITVRDLPGGAVEFDVELERRT